MRSCRSYQLRPPSAIGKTARREAAHPSLPQLVGASLDFLYTRHLAPGVCTMHLPHLDNALAFILAES